MFKLNTAEGLRLKPGDNVSLNRKGVWILADEEVSALSKMRRDKLDNYDKASLAIETRRSVIEQVKFYGAPSVVVMEDLLDPFETIGWDNMRGKRKIDFAFLKTGSMITPDRMLEFAVERDAPVFSPSTSLVVRAVSERMTEPLKRLIDARKNTFKGTLRFGVSWLLFI